MQLRELRPDDLEQAWALDADSFHVPADRREAFLSHTDPSRFIGVFEDGRLVALTGAYPFRQYFGGRAVPMGGLTSVAVTPDRRGGGRARQVIGAVVEAMRERGEVISSLLPAMTRLYRGLGWEVAGNLVWRRFAPRTLAALPPPDAIHVRPATEADHEAIRACYARLAPSVNGFLERPASWWNRLEQRWGERSRYVAEDPDGGLAGYLVYRQLDGEYSALGGAFGLAVDELVACSRDAALALWRLLASWATQVDRILYRGAAEDPLLLLLPEQELQTVAEVRWMTRVLDPVGAVEARGFAPGLDVEVQLALRDEAQGGEPQRFALSLHKGRGRLEPGGSGSLALDVGAFSSLYAGWASTALLARSGRLRGGSAEERAALDAAFAGPTPWMLDEF